MNTKRMIAFGLRKRFRLVTAGLLVLSSPLILSNHPSTATAQAANENAPSPVTDADRAMGGKSERQKIVASRLGNACRRIRQFAPQCQRERLIDHHVDSRLDASHPSGDRTDRQSGNLQWLVGDALAASVSRSTCDAQVGRRCSDFWLC